MEVIFCNSATGASHQKFKAGFKIQNQDAKGYPQNPNITFEIFQNGDCYSSQIASPKFCTTSSGGYCNLIVSLIPED